MGSDIERLLEYLLPVVMIGVEVVVCIALQRAILRRVEDLAAR